MSKLNKIVEQRRIDVAESKTKISIEELITKSKQIENELGPPLSLFDQIANRGTTKMFVAAEFKRASPSKGDIATDLNVKDQALAYAEAGAGLISVLTETKWFKGTLDDLEIARRVTNSMTPRPLILRKDFVFDEFQLYEARAYGADTVLLMKSVLNEKELGELIAKSRLLGMEPLVEVVDEEETLCALRCDARVLGVNNRNLHTFVVDMQTTQRIVKVLQDQNAQNVQLLALSGVKSREDVIPYEAAENCGMISGILVGEALMRSSNPRMFILHLVGDDNADVKKSTRVKICGINSVEAALTAAKAGADFIGMIFVPSSVRSVNLDQSKEIVQAIRAFREREGRINIEHPVAGSKGWFPSWADSLDRLCDSQARPLIVGVFMNQPIEYVNQIAVESGVDLIQLHGKESLEYEAQCVLPVIRVVHVDAGSSDPVSASKLVEGPASVVLLDTSVKGQASGGTGITFDWKIADAVGVHTPVLMAGGLVPTNVGRAVAEAHPWGVDVASGVESEPGVKDLAKIKEFISAAKAI